MEKLIELSEDADTNKKDGSIAMIQLFNTLNSETKTMTDLCEKLNKNMQYIRLINEKKNKRTLGFGSSLTINLPNIGIIMKKSNKPVPTRKKSGWGPKWLHNWTQGLKDSNKMQIHNVNILNITKLETLNSKFLTLGNASKETYLQTNPNTTTSTDLAINPVNNDAMLKTLGQIARKEQNSNQKGDGSEPAITVVENPILKLKKQTLSVSRGGSKSKKRRKTKKIAK
jgi:hypothetical protein